MSTELKNFAENSKTLAYRTKQNKLRGKKKKKNQVHSNRIQKYLQMIY